MVLGYVIKISESGEMQVLSINKEGNTLSQLQAMVGGYIETVRLSDELIMIVDEEGKLKERKVNQIATMISQWGFIDPIVGSAVIMKAGEDDLEFFEKDEAEKVLHELKKVLKMSEI